jgi:hypothetical protein
LLSVIALLSNAQSYRDISRFISTNFSSLQSELSLSWKRPPAYTTIRNIIRNVDKEELEAAFRAFTQSMTHYGQQDSPSGLVHIAVDGKVLRHSYDCFEDKGALQQLTFFDTEQSLILGHVAIGDKSNEIPAFQSLLSTLEIPGVIFTADALHLQKKHSEWRNQPVTRYLSNSRTTSNTCSKTCSA